MALLVGRMVACRASKSGKMNLMRCTDVSLLDMLGHLGCICHGGSGEGEIAKPLDTGDSE